MVLLGVGWVVGEVHTCEVDVAVCGVVELYPVVALAVLVGSDVVAGADLIDHDWRGTCCDEAFLLQGLEDGLQFDVSIAIEQKGTVAADDVVVDDHVGGCGVTYLGIPIEVGGTGDVVVHFDGYDVLTFAQQAYGKLYGAGVRIVVGIGRGVGIVGYLSVGQEVAVGFRAVDIDHEAVVCREVEH